MTATTNKRQPRRLAGEGNVRQRHEGLWEGRYRTADGHQRSCYGKTQREALDALKEAQRQAGAGMPVLNQRLKVADWLDTWLGEIERSRAPRTAESYRETCARYITPAIGNVPVAKLARGDGRGHGPRPRIPDEAAPLDSTTDQRYSVVVLRAALNRALRLGLVHRNVASLVTLPRGLTRGSPRRERRDRPTPSVACGRDARRRGVRLALASGLRQGDLLAHRWPGRGPRRWAADGPRVASSRHPEVAAAKTEASRRAVALDAATTAMLRDLRARQVRPLDRRLTSCSAARNGKPMHARLVARDRQAALAAAGLPQMPFHGLLHGYATLALEHGAPLAVISKSLGHSALATTVDVYSHLTPAMSEQVADIMGAVLGPVRRGSATAEGTVRVRVESERPRGLTPGASLHVQEVGWRGRIRTFDLLIQSQAPYRLATRQWGRRL